MKDLFGNEIIEQPIELNIYADEVQAKVCPYANEKWFYLGIVVENLNSPLLQDIISERFCNNFDQNSPYYDKNNRIVHWSEINDAETMHICKRWFEYILNTSRSGKKFYAYVLGINDSKLDKGRFGKRQEFNNKYNRFFRSAILYAIKTFFPNKKVMVKNIFHEEGQQEHHDYFPWHVIYKLQGNFDCDSVTFIPKDHRQDVRSNLIQLCDAFMGACVSIIHGIEQSKSSKYREQLMDLILPLVIRMVDEPSNVNSRYLHANRIMIRFFPKSRSSPDDIARLQNQFYTTRRLFYLESKSGQITLFSKY